MGRTVRGGVRAGRGRQAPERWPRASALALLAILGPSGCTGPVVFTVATAMPAYQVHQCVIEGLAAGGFRVAESSREAGIVRAERPGTLLGFPDPDEVDVITVVIHERRDGRTAVQYTAGRLYLDDWPTLEEPEGDVELIAQRVAQRCSG